MTSVASFADHPRAEFWAYEWNDGWSPGDVKKGHRYFWFWCDKEECGHCFQIKPVDIMQRNGWCPFCKNKKLCDEDCDVCFKKSLASHPRAESWSYEWNGDLTPRDVFLCSKYQAWFDCKDCGHCFQMRVYEIKTRDGWCSYCRSAKLCDDEDCVTCFEKSFASQPASIEWFYEKNGDVTPRQISKGSGMRFWFKCKDCGHTYDKILKNATKGKGCAYCYGVKLCDDKDCKDCEQKSFASHEKVQYWSEKNEVEPRSVFKGMQKKFLFDCPCGHEILISLESINKGYWCQYCCNHSRTLCDKEDCDNCFKKSFASHELVEYWSKKNKVSPRQVFQVTKEKYWFKCNCGHHFRISLLVLKHRGNWCPYCSTPPKKLCKKEKCVQCTNKSFASHPKAKFWDKKRNKKAPREVFKGSYYKMWFICEKKHRFKTRVCSVSVGTWCPTCKNKTEAKLHEELSKYYELTGARRFEWCRNNRGFFMPFDDGLKWNKTLIELDGEQHFKQVMNWEVPESRQAKDKYKMQKANQNGYSVIRLLQEDVYHNKNNWLERLLEAIDKINKEEIVQNIFLGSGDEYEAYMD